LGAEGQARTPVLEPVLAYRIILPEGCDARNILPKLRELEEEEPALHILWDELLQEIQVQLMGEVQTEILQRLIAERFGLLVQFGEGSILYKETISSAVEGVGHFEPMGHYAEVHLLLEPGERGSGLEFAVGCSEDVLAKNWQRLILTHLQEKTHVGVLTGSPITDMKITLVGGQASREITEGGDFREATYRAVRQGLMEARSVPLEPYYSFRLEVPEKQVGRAMSDMEKMQASWELAPSVGESAVLVGSAPVVTMRNYHREVAAYTRGLGRLSLSVEGYRPCHNAQDVIAAIGYDPERDAANPSGSIFFFNGSSVYVPWHEVKRVMHAPAFLQEEKRQAGSGPVIRHPVTSSADDYEDWGFWDTAANRGTQAGFKQSRAAGGKQDRQAASGRLPEPREQYLLVDGYNVIHAWPELKELAEDNMDIARIRLLDALANYQGLKQNKVMVVFDAYAVPDRTVAEVEQHHNIQVVYTKEAQTADEYIEKFAYDFKKDYEIVVATNDALQQVILRSGRPEKGWKRPTRTGGGWAALLWKKGSLRKSGSGWKRSGRMQGGRSSDRADQTGTPEVQQSGKSRVPAQVLPGKAWRLRRGGHPVGHHCPRPAAGSPEVLPPDLPGRTGGPAAGPHPRVPLYRPSYGGVKV